MNKMIEVIPYLKFKEGSCEEAIHAYINAFGGKIIGMSHWSEKNSDNPEQIGKVMHAEFVIGSTRMSGGDSDDCTEVKTDIRLMVHMDSEAEALQAMAVLAEGGAVLQPLKPHPEPDDGGCGSSVKDRFGYLWIITCPNPAKQRSSKHSEEEYIDETNIVDSRCGLHCTGCEYKNSCGCIGCIESNGHPFHGECPVALCCQNKGIVHCGGCPELPCELLKEYSFDPEHGDTPAGARIEQCKTWRGEGK